MDEEFAQLEDTSSEDFDLWLERLELETCEEDPRYLEWLEYVNEQ